MTNAMTIEQVRDMYVYVGNEVMASKPLLTEVDSAIGDGDHGIGMHVGFTEANQNLQTAQLNSVQDVFKTIGMSMINSMGGASGVIFGTLFLGGVKGSPQTELLNLDTLAAMLENALQAIKDRGKADLGDKTMIDALQPAVEALRQHADQSSDLLTAFRAAEEAAKQGVENTKQYISKFGRAKSLGERAIGYQDAGATSVWIIFRAMREWLESNGAASDE